MFNLFSAQQKSMRE